jgi:hypothetical protein
MMVTTFDGKSPFDLEIAMGVTHFPKKIFGFALKKKKFQHGSNPRLLDLESNAMSSTL